jgi:hypothetical protein
VLHKLREDVVDDLLHQLVLGREVVGDGALADADVLRDRRQRRLGEAHLGDDLDRGGDDLRAPARSMNERPFWPSASIPDLMARNSTSDQGVHVRSDRRGEV